MPMTFHCELSDQDLAHFKQAIAKAQAAAAGKSDDDVTAAARSLLAVAAKTTLPDFIAKRLDTLDAMIAMLADEAWSLPDEDRARVKAAMAYFSESDDLIPDDLPVLGFFDDAIAIELSAAEIRHELDAYAEFCEYRQEQAESRGLDAAAVGRADWLSARRDELINRMHRRRNREQGGGYGSSSGYAGSSYTSKAWRPGPLRVR
ncbi:hypothetical protein GCM10010960_20390 [Arenimonas maotaiensis]|uniref:DUF1232 domain-containing protein n=1 Tax=Arenimonas maotaiensis TaxID=1446479 RepID=A0A917FSU9_9GAMM|nr:YkvA family protein [Arenimonas maotaiensis]GGF98702.1 hypothetical protein GCM10010960_20390 [Arenimonas maotaiensis]